MKQEAEAAAQEAARQKAEAEKATAEAVAQQQALAAETDKAKQAAAQSDALRQQAEKEKEQAEYDKQELRARLLQQLNSILATRDSARGLIANMSDVLIPQRQLRTPARSPRAPGESFRNSLGVSKSARSHRRPHR